MKKIYNMTLAACLFVFGGCSNDEFKQTPVNEGMKSITSLTAILGDNADTRLHIIDGTQGGDKRMGWQWGDDIEVYSDQDTETHIFYVSSINESETVATFSGDAVTGNTFYAFFPEGSTRTAYEMINVDENNPLLLRVNYDNTYTAHPFPNEDFFTYAPLVAISDGTSFEFKQTTGLLHFAVSGLDMIGRVVLRGNNNEPLLGQGYIDLSEAEPKLVIEQGDTSMQILEVTEEGSDVIHIYFCIPPTTFTKGFTLEVWPENDAYADNNIIKTYSEQLTVGRAEVKTFPTIDVNGATVTSQEINDALTNAYATFFKGFESQWSPGVSYLDNYILGDVSGGDANKGSTEGDQSDFTEIQGYTFNASNSYLYSKWTGVYEAVKKANKVISMVNSADNAVTNPNEIIAQAKFIKAVWLFDGIRAFGSAIPYMSVEDYDSNPDNPTIGNVDGYGNYIHIWSLVEQDLKDAIDYLPATTGTDDGHVTSWMAKAILAKFYLYWSSPYNGTNATSNHWNDAKILLDDIINNGVNATGQRLKLAEKYGDLFDVNSNAGVAESLFDVQIISTYYTGNLQTGGYGFYQPTYEFVNSFIVDDSGLPSDNYQQHNPLASVNDGWIDSDLNTFVDPRLDFCAGRIGVPYWDLGTPTLTWIRSTSYGGPYTNKKFQDASGNYFYVSSGTSVKRYHVVRFADILLMRAECAIHDGDLGTALNLINQVRARAANDYVKNESRNGTMVDLVNGKNISGAAANYRIGLYSAFGSVDEAQRALERELRAEFGMEGHRWFDLVRWGKAADAINNFRIYENQFFTNKYPTAYNENWVTFPIPTKALERADGMIVQNENWGGPRGNSGSFEDFHANDLDW